MEDTSREYQIQSLNQIREEFSQNRTKVLLWLATGAGKTFIFCKMIKAAVAQGFPCIIIVRGRKLVDQASQRLLREKTAHGVLMRGHWNFRPTSPVQVCSIDTLLSRKIFPQAKLIIIDEADMATSKGFKTFLSHPEYKDSFIVPVTATPWVEDGLRHIADVVVHPITMEQLIEQGYLCGFRYFWGGEPDLKDVSVSASTGDYVVEQLEGAMNTNQLTGNIIDHWIKHAKGRPTFLFAVNVRHSKMLAEKFCLAGIPAEHLDANCSDKIRNEVIKRVEDGRTEVVCNVGIAGRGVDVPCVSCIILARPTKSRNLFIQQAGRGTRTFQGKSDCILLDHAGNIGRHGLPTDEPEVYLDGEPKLERVPRESKRCKYCFAVFRSATCPECGMVPPLAPIQVEESPDELVEIKTIDPILSRLKILNVERKMSGRDMKWVYWKLSKEFTKEQLAPYLPKYYADPFSESKFNRGNNVYRHKRTGQSSKGSEEEQPVAKGKEDIS